MLTRSSDDESFINFILSCFPSNDETRLSLMFTALHELSVEKLRGETGEEKLLELSDIWQILL